MLSGMALLSRRADIIVIGFVLLVLERGGGVFAQIHARGIPVVVLSIRIRGGATAQQKHPPTTDKRLHAYSS